jgi:acetate kinase
MAKTFPKSKTGNGTANSGGVMKILALNAGSSSLKFGLYDATSTGATLICEGEAGEVGRPHGYFWFRMAAGEKEQEDIRFADSSEAFRYATNALAKQKLPVPAAVGHRFVHGGNQVRNHARITSEVLCGLQAAVQFAPLHVPAALKIVVEAQTLYPGIPHVACLDTAFHRTMPDVSRTLPLPKAIRDLGVEKYGFHGLSVESIVRRLNPVPQRLVVAHLGAGCSISAVLEGKSIDNSMGLTPTGGVPMATRSGDLDPGVILFLLRHGYGAADELEDVLDHHSGLLGISEVSSDMRELIDDSAHDDRAALAIRMFSLRVRKSISSMAASLGGIDTLVFTGGIGEHATEWRDQLVRDLKFLAPLEVKVIPTEEDAMIAIITAGLCE